MEIFVVIALAVGAGLAVYQISMRASQPEPREPLPGSRLVREAIDGIGRLTSGRHAASSMTTAPPSSALATRSGSGTSVARAEEQPVAASVATEERSGAPVQQDEPTLGPVEPLSLEESVATTVHTEDQVFGQTLPPVEVTSDDGLRPEDYVPLASGYRSFQTRVIGFVGLAILVALLAVASTFGIYLMTSAVTGKITNSKHSPAPTISIRIQNSPGSQGSRHASPGPGAG